MKDVGHAERDKTTRIAGKNENFEGFCSQRESVRNKAKKETEVNGGV